MPTTVYKNLTGTDIFTDTTKVTAGIFNNGAGQLTGSIITTASISSSNNSYFHTITDSGGTEYFDVSFGSSYASGSDLSAGYNKSVRETEAVYKQFANVVLDDPYAKFAFTDISGSNSFSEDNIYVVSVKSAKMKDRVNGQFTLVMSGSDEVGAGGVATTLVLTNYTSSRYPSIAGDYYYVITGSAGTRDIGTGWDTVYGHFYPDVGSIVLSATKLSASIPGTSASTAAEGTHSGSDMGVGTGKGLNPDLRTDGNADNPMKLVNAFRSGSITVRSEQDLNQTTYYCRMFHQEFNFSSNPTFITSGSTLGDIIEPMVGDPSVYVSGVGLYNSFNELIAVAKLNVPQKKNFNKELTIAAKLDG